MDGANSPWTALNLDHRISVKDLHWIRLDRGWRGVLSLRQCDLHPQEVGPQCDATSDLLSERARMSLLRRILQPSDRPDPILMFEGVSQCQRLIGIHRDDGVRGRGSIGQHEGDAHLTRRAQFDGVDRGADPTTYKEVQPRTNGAFT